MEGCPAEIQIGQPWGDSIQYRQLTNLNARFVASVLNVVIYVPELFFTPKSQGRFHADFDTRTNTVVLSGGPQEPIELVFKLMGQMDAVAQSH